MTHTRRRRRALTQGERHTGVMVVGGFAIQGLVFVSGVLVARMLGVEDRGHLALLWIVALIFGQLGSLGLPLAVTYWMARSPESRTGVVRLVVGPAIVQCLLVAAVQAGVLAVIVKGDKPYVHVAAAVSLLVGPALVVIQYALAILQGARRFRAFSFYRGLPAAAYSVSAVVLFLMGVDDLVPVAVCWSLTTLAATAAMLLAAVTGLRGGQPAEGPLPRRTELLKFGLKGLPTSASPSETFQVDQAVVGLVISPAALGLYVAGLAFTNLSRIVAQNIGYVAYPYVARETDPAGARRELWKFFALAGVTCGAIVAVLEGTVGWLLPLFFGEEFSPAVKLARILLAGGMFIALRRVLVDALRGFGRQGLGTGSEALYWACLIPGALVMGPLFEATGVAIAVALSAFVSFGFLLLAALSRTPVGRLPEAETAAASTPARD